MDESITISAQGKNAAVSSISSFSALMKARAFGAAPTRRVELALSRKQKLKVATQHAPFGHNPVAAGAGDAPPGFSMMDCSVVRECAAETY
jgi:hypothetical protein